jgi:hypothetical protein
MPDWLNYILEHFFHWRFWQQFRLIEAVPPSSGSIFGLAEYLASLALFLVVMTASDFRYRYRLSLTRINLRRVGFWIGFGIGIAILVTDVWFQNHLPIPKLISNGNNLKALLGLIFLLFVFWLISVAIIRPPSFASANAEQFFRAHYQFIHQGNPDRLQVLAEELPRSIERIVAFAAKAPANPDSKATQTDTATERARHLLLLIGDRRFCRVVVDRAPVFAFACLLEAQKHVAGRLPIFQFARNIGQEFIRNTDSAFYQEGSGFHSGFVGYQKPVTNIIFGNYRFVEKCASEGESPIDTDYREFGSFDEKQMEGYTRAGLAFLESYLVATKGRAHAHSYALVRMLSSLESALSAVYRLDKREGSYDSPEYARLRLIVRFITDAMVLVEEHAAKPSTFRPPEQIFDNDIYDELAALIFETIFAASGVSAPPWTSWLVQHNSVWSPIFSMHKDQSYKIVGLKVRRLLYEEIKSMDEWANFKGARVLGYCLHVLGLTLRDRHTGYAKEFYPLQLVALRWVKANFRRLLSDHPQVAQACLQGSISYDNEGHRLVQTYENAIGKEPRRILFQLD